MQKNISVCEDTHFHSRCHQIIQILSPPEGVNQSLNTAHHIAELHNILRPTAPGKRPHQVPVNEQTRNWAAHSSCQTGKGLHLQGEIHTDVYRWTSFVDAASVRNLKYYNKQIIFAVSTVSVNWWTTQLQTKIHLLMTCPKGCCKNLWTLKLGSGFYSVFWFLNQFSMILQTWIKCDVVFKCQIHNHRTPGYNV